MQPGQTVLTLDTRDVQLAIDRAKAEQASAEAQLRLCRPARVSKTCARRNRRSIRHAPKWPPQKRSSSQPNRTSSASTRLLKNNSGSRKQRDDAATRRDVARDRVTQAESRVKTAEEVLAKLRAGARPEEVDAARARVNVVAAQIASLQKGVTDATLTSPIAGLVTEKLVEVGEMIAPRVPALVVVDLDHAWADVFVPEPTVPQIKIGQQATVFTDAGGAGLTGTITYVSPKAEFTPRNVQTAEERSKLVYRVRINVDNKEGILKQGMPVEAEIAEQSAVESRQLRVLGRSLQFAVQSTVAVRYETAIQFENVVKRYGKVDALRGVSFNVEKGEMFGLIGPDGAGKTTSIRAICGLLHVDGGTIRVLGKDPVKEHRDVTGTVGYLSQRFSLYGDLSIDENIAFFAEIHGVARLSRAPRSPARDDAVDEVQGPPCRSTVRRHEAEARAGVHAGARAAGHRPR